MKKRENKDESERERETETRRKKSSITTEWVFSCFFLLVLFQVLRIKKSRVFSWL